MTDNPDKSLTTEPLLGRAARGAKAGLRGSVVLCAIALVSALVGGPRSAAGRYLPVALLYYAGAGTLLGAVIAALLPLARYAAGAISIGALGGFALYSGAALIVDGPAAYRPTLPLMLGVPLGAFVAYAAWSDVRKGKFPPAA
jgi:hypothetical protein